jgi:hypothetical protein
MDQIAEAELLSREHGNDADTGRLTGRSLADVDSQFQGPVKSALGDPFTDSHAISMLTNMTANDIDEMDISTFRNEDTGGRSWICFHNLIKHVDCLTESAVVFDLHGRDSSTQHVVATFPSMVLSGDGTDEEGETLTTQQALIGDSLTL